MKLGNLNFKKDWKTTVLGIVASVLVIAGVLWPEKLDPETQQQVNSAFAQIVTGVGTLVAILTALFASDGTK